MPLIKFIVWSFDVLSVLTGFIILMFKQYLYKILLSTLAFIIFFPIIIEGGTRAYFLIRGKVMPRSNILDNELGWKSLPNINYKHTLPVYGEIASSSAKYGFRVFGDPDTSKVKIFVIGDSFTQGGGTVSDGNVYYDYLKERNDNIEIFAYGCGGYGSLQEYMILNRYFDRIKPDIVLWQFSPNDIINNSFELEASAGANNNRMRRPYYKNGQVVWLYPHPSWIYRNILRHSYFIRLAGIELDVIMAPHLDKSPEGRLTATDPLVKESMKTTSAIMSLARKRAGNTPIVAFSVQEAFGIDDEGFAAISQKNDIIISAVICLRFS